jgi:hypothetical protein
VRVVRPRGAVPDGGDSADTFDHAEDHASCSVRVGHCPFSRGKGEGREKGERKGEREPAKYLGRRGEGKAYDWRQRPRG